MRVLLLETDKLLASNVSRAFKASSIEVDWQVDPQEAVGAMDDQAVDAIVMDLVLAGRSGIEFLYELRSYADWRDLPVVLFSSVPPREVQSCAASLEQLGVAAYLFKPDAFLPELVKTVESCLESALA